MKRILLSKSVALGSLFLAALVFYSFNETVAFGEEWEVPAKYENMKNPLEADAESLDVGKSLYAKHCKSCHGKYGEGDGTKAAELEDFPGDFTEKEFAAQSDGALFYKSYIGRDEMPSFEKKIPDEEDIWHLVNYMRTFSE